MSTAINLNDIAPAMAIHPGEILLDELKNRNLNQKDFAALISYPKTQFNEVIKGKRNISADLALLIGKALNMDAEIWMNLQSQYELNLAKIELKNKKRIEAIGSWQMIESFIPIKYFKKEKLINGNMIDDLQKVKEIYQLDNLDQMPQRFSEPAFNFHYRKSEKLSVEQINLVAWSYLVQYKAEQKNVVEFDSRSKDDLINGLKPILLKNKKTVDQTEKLLSEFGIKLIIQENPDKCAVDGISFWNNGNPTIGLSLRHQRLDYFAFTLLHELGHVYLHLTSDNEAKFIDLETLGNDIKEEEANQFASEQLIDKQSWNDFLMDMRYFSDELIHSFAKRHHLNPAIVLGRYSHHTKKYAFKTKIDKSLK